MTNIETTDLFKGAFLLCMGGNLSNIRVEHNGRQTATFLITGNELNRHNEAYMTGNALVDPMQLKNALNHLRDVLFNTLRNQNAESQRYDRKQKNPTGSHQQNQDRHRYYHPNPIQRHSLKEKR
ncbi:MAG: hypothetical protein GY696_13090 [Gammaproteobacteria bacterium]|nr:hypothetical protein [Gammaproteobacteria bacterium]